MAYEIPGNILSVNAAGDLSGSFFRFVKMAGATIVAVTAATDDAIGVLQNKPAKAGDVGAVMIDGVTRVMSGAAIAAGVVCYMDASGRATGVVSAGAAVGITQTAVSAADLAVSVLLKPLGAVS